MPLPVALAGLASRAAPLVARAAPALARHTPQIARAVAPTLQRAAPLISRHLPRTGALVRRAAPLFASPLAVQGMTAMMNYGLHKLANAAKQRQRQPPRRF